MVRRDVILHQRALHRLFARIARHVYLRHTARIQTGIKHRCGHRAGRGIEILHLFGAQSRLFHVARQHDRIVQMAARMAGHEIRHQILIHMRVFIRLTIAAHEIIEYLRFRLAHVVQYARAYVFRRDLQLTGYVVAHQFIQEIRFRILQYVVKTDAGSDEHLFHAVDRAQTAQNIDVFRVIRLQIFARLREQALPSHTRAAL